MLNAARVFALHLAAPTLVAEFTAFGLPANFVADLQNDIAAYDTFVSAQSSAAQGASRAQVPSPTPSMP